MTSYGWMQGLSRTYDQNETVVTHSNGSHSCEDNLTETVETVCVQILMILSAYDLSHGLWKYNIKITNHFSGFMNNAG